MATENVRQVEEGPQYQGEDEEIVYTVDVSNVGSSPTSPSVVVKDTTNNASTDVTTTVMPTGSPSVNGDVITLPKLKSLTAGNSYRVEVKFTVGGNVAEVYFIVYGQV